jgi:hypothetical protein
VLDLAVAALARRGVKARYERGVLYTSIDMDVYLDNLTLQCLAAPRDQWPELVDRQMATVADPWSPSGQVLDLIRPRVAARDSLPQLDYGVNLADDLVGVLSVDYPDRVVTWGSHENFVEYGTFEELFHLGLERLWELPVGETWTLQQDEDHSETAVHFVMGDFFTASRILFLPDLLREYFGVLDLRDGALIGIPNRDLLFAHVLDGPESFEAVQPMKDLARSRFHEEPGGVSPNLYYTRGDGWFERFTDLTG